MLPFHSTCTFFDRILNSHLIKILKRSAWNSQSLKLKIRSLKLNGLPQTCSVSTTTSINSSSKITLEEEQALKTRLVNLYLEEDNFKVVTPEHLTRSEIELNWLKIGARKHLIRLTRQSTPSIISLQSHLPLRPTRKISLNQILIEWVDQYVSQKKPLAYILGDVPFGNLTFSIRPPILIPRSETEEWVIKLSNKMKSYFQSNHSTFSHPDMTNNNSNTDHLVTNSKISRPWFKVLDIGTGSGCISNYLAYHHQHVHAVGIDIHQDAIGLARENATIHRILFPKSHMNIPTTMIRKDIKKKDWSNPFSSLLNNGRASFFNLDIFSPTFTKNLLEKSQSLVGFDIIISNPPYINYSNYLNLPCSVKNWESPIALLGDRKFTPIDSPHASLSRSNRPIGEFGFFTTSYRSPSSIDDTHDSNYTQSELLSKSKENIELNGLDFYKQIVDLISKGNLLKNNSHHLNNLSLNLQEEKLDEVNNRLPKIVFEVGDANQARLVKQIILNSLAPHIISHVEIWKDFSGIERTILAY